MGFEVVTVSTVGEPAPAAQKRNSGDYRLVEAGRREPPKSLCLRTELRLPWEPSPLDLEPERLFSSSRCGFCYMEAELVPAGLYNVVPTTFLPKQEGPFFLDFSSTSALKVSQLQ